jgi:type IV pilus assembly protein PilA
MHHEIQPQAAARLSAYQNYIARAQFAEAPTLIDGLKTSVVEYATQNGSCPSNSGTTATDGFSDPEKYTGQYVAQIDLDTGTSTGESSSDALVCSIQATFKETGVSPALTGETVTYTSGDFNDSEMGTITWTCTTSVEDPFRPNTCTTTESSSSSTS